MKDNNPYLIPFYIPQEGCRHKCAYCNSYLATYGEACAITQTYFENRVDKFLETRNGKGDHAEIAFYGGSFNTLSTKKRNYYLNLTNRYIKNGQIDSLRVSIRPDSLSEELLNLFVENKVRVVELGIQSMNDLTLKAIERGHSEKDVINAFEKLSSRKILISAHLMIGLPGEEQVDFLNSLKKVIALKPEFLRFHPTLVLKGTGLEKMYRKGLYRPLSIEEASQICAAGYSLAVGRGINVLRMGLQSNEMLNSGDAIIAGPWHVSFGEIVYSKIFLDKIEKIIKENNLSGKEKVTFKINPYDLSKALGHNKTNIEELKSRYAIKDISILSDRAVSINSVGLS